MGKKHIKDPTEWLIKRQRDDGKHIDNCKDGYRKKGFSQIHHILCISCLQDASIAVPPSALDFIRDCLHVTEWDINAKHNCIGLPLKHTYYMKPRDGWDDLPCHLIDHNPHYTRGVTDWLNENVWRPLMEEREECNIEVTDLVAMLEDGSDHWRSHLTTRGASNGGTRQCWKDRHKPGMANTWYIPFSMHPSDPPERKPPPDWDGLKSSMKALLKRCFVMV